MHIEIKLNQATNKYELGSWATQTGTGAPGCSTSYQWSVIKTYARDDRKKAETFLNRLASKHSLRIVDQLGKPTHARDD